MAKYQIGRLQADGGPEQLLVPCVVISEPGSGPPCPVLVLCSQEEYNAGEHYERAADGATSYSWLSSNSENTVVFDCNDGPAWLFEHFTPDEFICIDADNNKVSVSGWGEDYQKPAVLPPTREELLAVCKQLKEWEGHMGGWDAPVWTDLQTLLEREAGLLPAAEESLDEQYRCQNCGHVDDEDEFVPSDGNPAPHVCPECGLTDVFPQDPETDVLPPETVGEEEEEEE